MASVYELNSLSNYSMNCGWARSASTNKEFARPKLNYIMGIPPEPASINTSEKTAEIYQRAATAPAQLYVSGKTESRDQAVLGPLVLDGAEIVKELSGNVRD